MIQRALQGSSSSHRIPDSPSADPYSSMTNCYVWGCSQDDRLGLLPSSSSSSLSWSSKRPDLIGPTRTKHPISKSNPKAKKWTGTSFPSSSQSTSSPSLPSLPSPKMIRQPIPHSIFVPPYSVHQIACGYRHTLFVFQNGVGIMGSGSNQHGQCGPRPNRNIHVNATTKHYRNPTPIPSPTNVGDTKVLHSIPIQDLKSQTNVVLQAIAAGYASSYALSKEGELWSWGSMKFSCLGYDAEESETFSHKSSSLSSSSSSSVGPSLPSNVKHKNYEKQNDYHPYPQRILALKGYIINSISCSFHHCIVLRNDGICMGWGRNQWSQLGLGIHYESVPVMNVPTEIPFPETIQNVIQIACGPQHTLAICSSLTSSTKEEESCSTSSSSYPQDMDSSTVVLGWGSTDDYRLGHALPSKVQSSPLPIPYFSKEPRRNILEVKAGHSHSLALDSKGYVHSWGLGTYGALGMGQVWECPEPMMIPGMQDVVKIEAGYRSSYAIQKPNRHKEDGGELYSWGANAMGELGLMDDQIRIQPHKVTSLLYSNVVNVFAGHSHCTCITNGKGKQVKDMKHYRKYFELFKEGGPVLFPTLQKDMQRKGLQHHFLETPDLILSDQDPNIQYDKCLTETNPPRINLRPIPDEIQCLQYCFDTLPNASTNIGICNLRGSYETVHSCSICQLTRICMVCARKCHTNHCLTPSLISTNIRRNRNDNDKEMKDAPSDDDDDNDNDDADNTTLQNPKKLDENKCQCCQTRECNARWTPMRHEFDTMAEDLEGVIMQSQIPDLLERLRGDIELRTDGLLLTKSRKAQALKSVGEALCELNDEEEIFKQNSMDHRSVHFKEFEHWYTHFFQSDEDEE